MNETNCMCERCGEMPAEVLVEHVTYGEAICTLCRDDEDKHEMENVVNWYADDTKF